MAGCWSSQQPGGHCVGGGQKRQRKRSCQVEIINYVIRRQWYSAVVTANRLLQQQHSTTPMIGHWSLDLAADSSSSSSSRQECITKQRRKWQKWSNLAMESLQRLQSPTTDHHQLLSLTWATTSHQPWNRELSSFSESVLN